MFVVSRAYSLVFARTVRERRSTTPWPKGTTKNVTNTIYVGNENCRPAKYRLTLHPFRTSPRPHYHPLHPDPTTPTSFHPSPPLSSPQVSPPLLCELSGLQAFAAAPSIYFSRDSPAPRRLHHPATRAPTWPTRTTPSGSTRHPRNCQ